MNYHLSREFVLSDPIPPGETPLLPAPLGFPPVDMEAAHKAVAAVYDVPNAAASSCELVSIRLTTESRDTDILAVLAAAGIAASGISEDIGPDGRKSNEFQVLEDDDIIGLINLIPAT